MLNVTLSFLQSISSSCVLQVGEKLLDSKALKFYKWDGDLPQLLQNVRDKLNKVAEVSFLILLIVCIHFFQMFKESSIGLFWFRFYT